MNSFRQDDIVSAQLLAAIPDGVALYDHASGTFTAVNTAFARMHGYTEDDLIGEHLRVVIIEPLGDGIEAVLSISNGHPNYQRTTHRRKDGTTFPAEINVSRIASEEGDFRLAVVRDISDRVLAYERLSAQFAERTRELQLLLDISHDVAGTLELGPLVGLILDRVKGVVDYDGAAMFLLDEDGDGLNLLRYQGPIPQHTLAWRWYLTSHAHARAVVTSGQPVIIPDVFADTPLARSFRTNATSDIGEVRSDFGTWMGVPMSIGQRTVGMLAVEFHEVGYYGERQAELLLAVARQAAVAVENARLFEQARGIAALEERQKLARDLHDSVSQALYGIALGARTARRLLDRDPSRIAEPLDYVLQLAEAGLTEMRSLIFELRPESLEQEGLVVALEKQAASLRARHGLDVSTELIQEPDISLLAKEALYRIAQESLHNTVKHARATSVTIRLIQDDMALKLEVSDNGIGFDPHGSFPGHLGLRSMRERAARQGATIEIESGIGQGTRTILRLPAAR